MLARARRLASVRQMHPALLIAFAAALPAVSTLAAADLAPLRQALTFHAAFDGKFDAVQQ